MNWDSARPSWTWRGCFDDEQRLRRELAEVALAWLRGGNVFMLRYALRRSGGDTAFRDLLERRVH